MNHIGYLIAGWGISLGTLGLYGWRLIIRGRSLSALVPPEARRWMTASTDENDSRS